MKVTGDSRVRDVIERHPASGSIFVQHGVLFRNKRGELYAAYDPDLTVSTFAADNGVAIDDLLALLDAAIEADRAEPGVGPQRHRADRPAASPRLSIGYTGSYREPADVDVRPVVQVQRSRGPL